LKNIEKYPEVHKKVPMFRVIETHPAWIENIEKLLKATEKVVSIVQRKY
jgi:hypothetical protein